MEMKVEAAHKYDGKFPVYNLPIEIGSFSLNSNGKFCNDRHQLKYLVMPNKLRGLHMDLDEGYSQYIDTSEDSEYNFDMIFRWIVANQEVVKKHFIDRFTSGTKIDFICFRGPLLHITSTIYEKNSNWLMIAEKYKSTIYLALSHTEEYIESVEKMSERDRRMCTWGFKFEQYMTSDKMNTKPNTSVPVNSNEKFYCVMKGKLGNHILLFGSEMDAVDPAHFDVPGQDPTSVLRYVELKTRRIIENKKQDWTFRRYKLLQWYLQSFLVGIPRVICGFRDDGGIVRELDIFNVRDIPKMADGIWSPAASLNFCSRFLDFVKQNVVKDHPTASYLFHWEPHSDIICEEIVRENPLLPEWYTKNLTID